MNMYLDNFTSLLNFKVKGQDHMGLNTFLSARAVLSLEQGFYLLHSELHQI